MEKQKYVKPSAVSLDDVSAALGATCTHSGSDGVSYLACNPTGGDASNNCENGGTAGFRSNGNCLAGGTAKWACGSGSVAAFG